MKLNLEMNQQCRRGYEDAEKMKKALRFDINIGFDEGGADGYGEIDFGGIACMWLGDDGAWWTAEIEYWPGNHYEPPCTDISQETKHPHRSEALTEVFHRVLEYEMNTILDNWSYEAMNESPS